MIYKSLSEKPENLMVVKIKYDLESQVKLERILFEVHLHMY